MPTSKYEEEMYLGRREYHGLFSPQMRGGHDKKMVDIKMKKEKTKKTEVEKYKVISISLVIAILLSFISITFIEVSILRNKNVDFLDKFGINALLTGIYQDTIILLILFLIYFSLTYRDYIKESIIQINCLTKCIIVGIFSVPIGGIINGIFFGILNIDYSSLIFFFIPFTITFGINYMYSKRIVIALFFGIIAASINFFAMIGFFVYLLLFESITGEEIRLMGH